ncbi:alcohol dehydrogenase catalytic domain-containing protein [Halalkalibacter alkalisediminis]|uniref:alcohol dehydrogenase catalytic domain-containing protein n=1 Tax=Halalkalibacter alkalisediminis TaxID=935616 RepID=UPI0036309751
MKAFVHEGIQGIAGTYLREHKELDPKENEVRVRMKYAGVNHRDLFVLDRHALTDPPLVIGSDGAGIIELVGTAVSDFKVGDEVIINPSLRWLQKTDAPPVDFEILGLPDDGTLAKKVVISSDNIERKREHLSWEEAGVLSLAALTAYRALFTQAEVNPTDTILLPGIGGGSGHVFIIIC